MRAARAFVAYAILTVALTWPLALRLRIMDPGDAAFFTWEVGWTIHALKTDWSALPHGNIFYPARYTLGMDEPVVGTTLLALPLSLLSDDAVLLFNLIRLLTYALSALGVYLLSRELGCGEGPALIAGAVFAFSPLRADQVAFLSTLGTQWLPFVLLFLHRFARSGRVVHGLLAGLFYALAGWACGYHGLLGLLVLPPAALVLFWGRVDRFVKGLPGAALAALLLYPLYLLHHLAFVETGFARSRAETVLYSASLESFVATSPWNWLYGGLTEPFRGSSGFLFPGLVVPALILYAAFRLWRQRRPPSRDALALAAVGLASIVVALGPEIRLMGRSLMPAPFGWLRDAFPVFQDVRVTSRAGMFLALALAVLFAKALNAWRDRPSRLGLVFVLAMAETVIAPIPLASWAMVVDSSKPPPPVYAWLRDQPGDFAIVELPIVPDDGYFRKPAFHESIYMVRSTLHWKKLVNGYAGAEPETYKRARELARRFPTQAFLDDMRGLGVRYVVLHRRGYGPNKWARIERELPRFTDQLEVAAGFAEDTVFRILPPPAAAAEPLSP
jgi:hypothetical protein